ncbi:MAG: GTP-binding protein [Spirochaetaceae bacterium]|nr:GTP-binding protein [Spirochaetaceae bacterium]
MQATGNVPVHVLSGFLGSGKTTLLNRLLAALPPGTRPAVVVNDFGAVAVDGALVDRGSYAVAELASGCVCCTLSAPMQEALAALLDDEEPDVILMETTGLAEPAAFPALFAAPALADRIRLGNVACVVDASTYLRYADHLLVLPRQVEQANTVIMNKTDLAGAATQEAVRRRLLATCPPGALLLAAERCAVDPAVVYDERPVYFAGSGHRTGHYHEFRSLTVELPRPVAAAALRQLLQGLAGEVERAKGLVHTDAGAKLAQLTLAGVELEDWPEPVADSRITFVGRNLDALDLPAGLAALEAG